MTRMEYLRQVYFYFMRLPLFSLRLAVSSFERLEDAAMLCPSGPKTEVYYRSISEACNKYGFLKGRDAARLSSLYNLISTIREADVFLYPFLTAKNVRSFNSFHGLETLSEVYNNGPVLVLYSHTGSYYQIPCATAELGYRICPIAYGSDLAEMEKPFRLLYLMNMKLSERHFRGGQYLYSNLPGFARALKRIIAGREKTLIYAALDLPRSFITEKRGKVDFLGGQSAFPDRIIELFARQGLPVITAFPYIDIDGQRIKRIVNYERAPDGLDSAGVLRHYATRLEGFITERPEQLLTLISLGAFFE